MSNDNLILGIAVLIVILYITYFILSYIEKKNNAILKKFIINIQLDKLELQTENLSLDIPLFEIKKIRTGRLSTIINMLASLLLVVVLLASLVPGLISFSSFFIALTSLFGVYSYIITIIWFFIPIYFIVSLIKAIINTGWFYVMITPGNESNINRNLVLVLSTKDDAQKLYKQLLEKVLP